MLFDDSKIGQLVAANENLMANNRALTDSLDKCMSSSKFLVEVLRKNGIMEDISPSRQEYSRLKKQLGEKRQTVMAEHPGQPHNNREMHIYGYFEHELRVLMDENTKYLRRAHDAEIAGKSAKQKENQALQENETLRAKVRQLDAEAESFNTPLESVLKAPLITEIGNLTAQLKTLQGYIDQCNQSAERNSTTIRRLEKDNNSLRQEVKELKDNNSLRQEVKDLKAIKSENTQLVGLQTELKAEINRSSNLHKQTGLLDRIKKVFTLSIPERPKEINVAQQDAKIRAFGENASNSGTPIMDRIKRFRKPPTQQQKLRAKYRQVRKTKGERNWDSVKLTPKDS